MSDPTNKPVDNGKNQAIEGDEVLSQNEEDKTASSLIDNNLNLPIYTHQTGPAEKEIILHKKAELTNIASPTDDKESIQAQTYKQTLSIVIVQIILVVMMFGLSEGYGWFHNVPSAFTVMFKDKGIEAYSEAIANYNFVGVSPDKPQPSFFSVMIEAGIWSFAGVLARSEYYLTQVVIRRKELRLLETISKLIGDAAMGIAIAMAVVAFLRSTELVNLTLKTADIGAIGAIAFVLGFYHEDTRRLLGSFRRTVSGSAQDAKEGE